MSGQGEGQPGEETQLPGAKNNEVVRNRVSSLCSERGRETPTKSAIRSSDLRRTRVKKTRGGTGEGSGESLNNEIKISLRRTAACPSRGGETVLHTKGRQGGRSHRG